MIGISRCNDTETTTFCESDINALLHFHFKKQNRPLKGTGAKRVRERVGMGPKFHSVQISTIIARSGFYPSRYASLPPPRRLCFHMCLSLCLFVC